MPAVGPQPGLRVVHVEPPSPSLQGDQIYRTRQPCAALGALDEVGSVVSGAYLQTDLRRQILAADVLVLCQAVEVDLLPLWQARAAAGRANVFEINDDFAALQTFNASASFYANPLIRSLTFQLAQSAHGLQFSSHGLQARFGHLAPPQALLMNQLQRPPAPLLPAPAWESPQAPLWLGWGGSLGHRDDVAAILPALQTLLQRHPRLHWAAMCDRSLHGLFAALPPARVRLVGLGDLGAYARFVAGLDLGLAPLLPTAFNLGRSDVKYLEYAAAGVLALVQDGPTYRPTVREGENGLLFDGPAGLVPAVEKVLAAPQQAQAIRRCAWEEVAHGRLEAQHAPRRLAWYRDCQQRAAAGLGQRSPRQKPLPPQAAPPAASLPGWRRGRYVAMQPTRAEAALYAAMLTRQTPTVAQRHLDEARRRAPQAHLPELLRGQMAARPAVALQALRRARQLQPASLHAAYDLGKHLLMQGQRAEGRAAFVAALRICDAFAPAHEALGHLAEAEGEDEAARGHWRDAVAANPFYTVPHGRLAVALLQVGGDEARKEARLCLQQGLQVEPRSWLLRHLLADTLLQQNKARAALAQAKLALELADEKRPVQALLAKIYLALGQPKAAKLLAAQLEATQESRRDCSTSSSRG